ncbi:MAG TPA: hypothetical protein VJR47_18045 [Stellaceae bacterium]|nr:hypothetical protein [Stellaceae bacterium]
MKAATTFVLDHNDDMHQSRAEVPSGGRLGFAIMGAFALALGTAVILRYNSFFPSVIDSDESLYAVIAQHWLRGELPYRFTWDQHSIGLPALFAAIEFLFGNSIAAIRVSACVAVAAAATAIYFTSLRLERHRVAAFIAAGFYVAWTTRWWGFPANCELYLNALTVPSLLIVLSELGAATDYARKLRRYCLAALLLGIALQIKQVIIAETALLLATMVATVDRPRRVKTFLFASFFIGLPTIVVVGYFWLNGLLAEYFRAVVVSNLIYATSYPSASHLLSRLPHSFILPIGLAILASCLIWKRPTRPHALVVAWIVASAVDLVLPGQFWPHYFLLLLPGASILTGTLVNRLTMDRPWRQQHPRWAACSAVVAAIVSFNPVGIYRDTVKVKTFARNDVAREIADRIKARISPAETVFVFNYQPIIYFLVGSALPTKHVLPADWGRQFAATAGVQPLRAVEAVFAKKPDFVVVAERDSLQVGNAAEAAFRKYLSAYTEKFKVVDTLTMPEPVTVKIYRREPAATPSLDLSLQPAPNIGKSVER